MKPLKYKARELWHIRRILRHIEIEPTYELAELKPLGNQPCWASRILDRKEPSEGIGYSCETETLPICIVENIRVAESLEKKGKHEIALRYYKDAAKYANIWFKGVVKFDYGFPNKATEYKKV